MPKKEVKKVKVPKGKQHYWIKDQQTGKKRKALLPRSEYEKRVYTSKHEQSRKKAVKHKPKKIEPTPTTPAPIITANDFLEKSARKPKTKRSIKLEKTEKIYSILKDIVSKLDIDETDLIWMRIGSYVKLQFSLKQLQQAIDGDIILKLKDSNLFLNDLRVEELDDVISNLKENHFWLSKYDKKGQHETIIVNRDELLGFLNRY